MTGESAYIKSICCWKKTNMRINKYAYKSMYFKRNVDKMHMKFWADIEVGTD